MRTFFATGYAIDAVLAFLVLESVVLVFIGYASLATAVIAALPGACLLLAIRAALTGADWQWVALWVGLSLPAHLADLWRRRARRLF